METELKTIKKWIIDRIEIMDNKEKLSKLQKVIYDWELKDIKIQSLKIITTQPRKSNLL